MNNIVDKYIIFSSIDIGCIEFILNVINLFI